MVSLLWQDVAPGIWRAEIGGREALSPASVADAQPRLEALRALGEPGFPLDPALTTAETAGARTVTCLSWGTL